MCHIYAFGIIKDGTPSATFMSALTQGAKSKIIATVPGNHDFWVNAMPSLWVPKDQQGQGFMQFYGMDVIASAGSEKAAPFDFSVDPDGANKGRNNLAHVSNFMFYNKVGNVGFIGFSGAHSFASQQAYFTEACTWASAANPDVLLLLGHWNNDGDGCDGASAPEVYAQLAALPACAPVSKRMKYFMGHKHCNIVTEPNVGFMVGALGMGDMYV